MGRTRLAVAALVCTLLAGCGTATKPAPTATSAQQDGTCALDSLPAEVSSTVDLIASGGPFLYPRNDGVVFGNFGGRLPSEGVDLWLAA